MVFAQACDEFKRQRFAGKCSHIEDFLKDTSDRERLLRELISLELVLRGDAGQRIDLREFHQRFPDDGQIVRSVLDAVGTPNQSMLSTEDVRRSEHNEDSRVTPYRASFALVRTADTATAAAIDRVQRWLMAGRARVAFNSQLIGLNGRHGQTGC